MGEGFLYEIRVEGQLSVGWKDWFDGLDIKYVTSERDQLLTVLHGRMDQATLRGVLWKVFDLGIMVVSVIRIEPGAEGA